MTDVEKEYVLESVPHTVLIKIESYHKILYRELITQKWFKSLAHFERELNKFDRRWNNWRKQQGLGWKTPSSIYNDKKYFNKRNHS
ncbi:MAG: integrase core domain-containing protein [Nitrososphaerales archaeon]